MILTVAAAAPLVVVEPASSGRRSATKALTAAAAAAAEVAGPPPHGVRWRASPRTSASRAAPLRSAVAAARCAASRTLACAEEEDPFCYPSLCLRQTSLRETLPPGCQAASNLPPAARTVHRHRLPAPHGPLDPHLQLRKSRQLAGTASATSRPAPLAAARATAQSHRRYRGRGSRRPPAAR